MIYFFDSDGRCLCRKDGGATTVDTGLLATWVSELGATWFITNSTVYDINLIYTTTGSTIVEMSTIPGDNYSWNYSTHAWVFSDTDALNAMNQQINILLRASDWTQLRDADDTVQSDWATYRQALRDLPSNTSDLSDITWPTPPS